MLLNLWDYDECIKAFMKLYGITEKQMCAIFRRLYNDAENDNVSVFCEETGIKLDKISVAHNVEMLGKIVSTTVDEFQHLKKAGVITLDALLENDSPISNHLKEYQIEIKPSTHEFSYKGKKYYIPDSKEDCKWCAYGDKECGFDKPNEKDIFCEHMDVSPNKNTLCDYRHSMSYLSSKLYHDNAEIEAFLYATEDTMLKYSTVKNHPEIFVTIDNLIDDFFGDKLYIGKAWAEKKQHTYIATIPIKYEDMSYKNGYIDSKKNCLGEARDKYGRYEDFCDKEYDDTEAGFKKIISKLGYEDERVLLKRLQQGGYLNHEKDKYSRKRRLRDSDLTSTKMYVIYEFQEVVTNDGDVFVVEDEAENPF